MQTRSGTHVGSLMGSNMSSRFLSGSLDGHGRGSKSGSGAYGSVLTQWHQALVPSIFHGIMSAGTGG